MEGGGDLKNVDHISSSWVKIRLHTGNQLPRLPGYISLSGGGWMGGPTDYFVTPNLS